MKDQEIMPVGNSRERFRGRLLRVTEQDVRFPDGTIKTFERAERAPGVRVLVTTRDQILLTEEWRSEQHGLDYRLPGGKVFDSLEEYIRHTGDGVEQLGRFARLAAKKELLEETSIDMPLDRFEEFHSSACGATVEWTLYYYRVNVDNAPQQFDRIDTHEGERIQPLWVPLGEIKRMCLDGRIKEDRTVAVLLRYVISTERGL